MTDTMTGSYGEELLAAALAGTDPDDSPVTHTEVIPAAQARFAHWPQWLDPAIVAAFAELGVHRPWRHQIDAAEHAHAGRHVVVATGTASGKSLAYQLPVLQALLGDHNATALYLAPTKALGVDQLRSFTAILATNPDFARLAPCTYDGDTDAQLRQWARANSRMVFTNPDMLHIGILSGHHRWQQFLRQLRYIVVDECHHYRGVFGAHTALVLRRLLRVARAVGADPVVVAASATTAEPAATLSALVGEPAVEVTDDASPTGQRTVALWEPPFLPEVTGENGAPVRRSAGAEAGRLLADFVIEGARTLCFVRSRRGAEITARTAAGLLAASAPDLAGRVAAYRAGYLADDRRRLERAIADGELLGVATTNALELGVDISGLDAVVIAGYPGTVASFWQQAGRAGRRGAASAVVLVARDDPLDTYLVHHPEALLRKPVEATVFDPMNPYVLRPHLLCAAAELPLKPEEVARLGVTDVVDELTADGLLRRRKAGWYLGAGSEASGPNRQGGRVDPHAEIDIRGGIGGQILIVDTSTSQLLGTVDTVRALSTVHPGAVHIHQGRSFVVDELDLDDGLALVHPEEPDWTTSPRETTDVEVVAVEQVVERGALRVALVEVTVTSQVVGYLRKLHSGEILDSVELDLPAQTLPTRAVQYTLTPEALAAVGVTDANLPGALHAAEHAMIGMLPLVATCDRWDIGGLSTNLHPDTGLPTVFVYDGYPGGAGFADRGYAAFGEWVAATAEAVSSCGCEKGCPSCVQSPKCGNGNEPLDKAGAIAVLELIGRLLG